MVLSDLIRVLKKNGNDYLTNGEALKMIDLVQSSNTINYDEVYPVGSIYQTMDDAFNPSTVFGGTWERLEAGRFLQSADSGAGDKVEAGLPNATGTAQLLMSTTAKQSGMIRLTGAGRGQYGLQSGSQAQVVLDTIEVNLTNAADDNNIYGNSNTVQPPAIKCNIWVRKA